MYLRLLFILAILALPNPVQADVAATDKGYFSEIELKAKSFSEPRRDLLLNFIHYLQTGKAKDADAYIRALKSYAPTNGQPKLSFSIFEGDFDLCHIENGACTRGLGELTEKYLVPRLKDGDKKALELLFIHTSLVTSDGAETENLESLLKRMKIPSRFKSFFDSLRRSDPLFARFPNRWM